MNRLPASAALGRGVANLRANAELILVAAGGSVALCLILFLSVLPWVSTLGIDLEWFTGKQPDVNQLRDFIAGLSSVPEIVARLGGLLLSFTLALTLASVLWCWYTAGILGVLVAGEAQAPPGVGREPALFRTFSMRLFVHEAGRLFWRYFLYVNLFFCYWLGFGVLVVAVFVGAGVLGKGAGLGFGAGCAVACGALLPLLFVSFALLGAMSLGQAHLVRPESGVIAASVAGFRALSRRLGASLLVICLLFAASILITLVSSVADVVGGFALSGAPAIAFKVVVLLVEMVLGAVVSLGATAAFIALFRDDAARQTAPVTA